jgi:exodeoxyribonuclease V alpha subunit
MARVKAEIVRVKVVNEDKFTLIDFTEVRKDQPALFDAAECMTAVGVVDIPPMPGYIVELEGKWKTHPRYGRQLHIEHLIYLDDAAAITALLASGLLAYIKLAMAKRVAAALGGEAFEVLDRAAEGDAEATARLGKIKGIGPITGPRIIESWREERFWARGALACTRAGLTLKMAKRARMIFGEDLANIVTKKPYQLTRVRGISFERADRIAMMAWPGKEPIDRDAPQRYAAAVRHILEEGLKDGQMCLEHERTGIRAAELLKPKKSVWCTLERHLGAEGIIVTRDKWVYLERAYKLETELAARVASVMRNRIDEDISANVDPDNFIGVSLVDEQKAAIRMTLAHPVSIITGGPGTGKTTITQAIVNIARTWGRTVVCASPTGKAADRLTEATLIDAKTIHRSLGIVNPDDPTFRLNRWWEGDFIVVDEVSMMDTLLAHHVFDAVSPKAQIVLVGDVDQLPSVGPGEVLHQLIKAGVPTARLKQIHRQGADSGIVHAAHMINGGKYPTLKGRGFTDCFIGTALDNKRLVPLMAEYIGKIMEKYGFDQVQVLCGVKQRAFGTHALNRVLQEHFNPGPPQLPGLPFRPHDRVIHIRNNYDLGVFNGEVGEVVWMITPEGEKMERRAVTKTREGGGEASDPIVMTVRYRDEKQIHYTREVAGEELQLAYALTIHKAQGSEFPAVMLLVPMVWRPFMTRQLVYTGLTRARQYAMVIETQGALHTHVSNEARVRRFTNLAAFINKGGNTYDSG